LQIAQTNPHLLNTPKFLATICDVATIRKIGTDYRSKTPAESREGELNNLLTTGLDDSKDQTEELTRRIKDDFANNRTVTIDGYVISITEARQCALYSLQLP
jgi:hypothetical protein